MNDSQFQQLSTVANTQMPVPKRLASAATIAPTTFLSFISGTVQIATITPPTEGWHMLAFVFTDANPAAFLNTGNVESTRDPVQNEVLFLVYDPVTAQYYINNP